RDQPHPERAEVQKRRVEESGRRQIGSSACNRCVKLKLRTEEFSFRLCLNCSVPKENVYQTSVVFALLDFGAGYSCLSPVRPFTGSKQAAGFSQPRARDAQPAEVSMGRSSGPIG